MNLDLNIQEKFYFLWFYNLNSPASIPVNITDTTS